MTDNPLGLTEQQEWESALYSFPRELWERAARNRELIEALPPGTIVCIAGQPDRTREQLLELML